jgi:hypothetical protein
MTASQGASPIVVPGLRTPHGGDDRLFDRERQTAI